MRAKFSLRSSTLLAVTCATLLAQNPAMAAACLQTVVKSGSLVISSPFGWRFGANPNGKGKWQFHYGTDFSKKALPDPMVVAPIEGKYMAYSGLGQCGNMVVIQQPDGLSAKFCHLKNFEPDASGKPRVNGSTISVGDKIGVPSNTGILPNPEHIHLEVITKGDPSQTSAFRIPPPFCGGVSFSYQAAVDTPDRKPPLSLIRPAGATKDNVYGAGDKNFDKAFYDQYMVQNATTGTIPSSAIANSNTTTNVDLAKMNQSGANASKQPVIPAPVLAEEMSFSEMIGSEARKRFGSEQWYSELAQKAELPLYYDLAVMTAYQIYMQYQKQEVAENIVQLSATRTALLNEVASQIKVKKLRDPALLSIAPK
ncbi:M23 family metallopeptidase [Undibacterium sp. TS12]|uniref:M23 family metallopeptidase n=1 Tax=Undibacterium sp. TS12 TaxID=2908202 RepID=UPI001F4CAF69|nr:M23 family metallopeptidase [Undibacterium sp. TS12]MCH8621313.1 M23 family metallopeptidase [Undibacterium sp. TS12]